LFRIANNEVCSYFRKPKVPIVSVEQLREGHGFDVPGEGTASSLLVAHETELEVFSNFRLINLAMRHLSEDYAEVLQLRYFEKMQIKDIMDILGKKKELLNLYYLEVLVN